MSSRVRIAKPADDLECLRLHEVAQLLHISKHTLRSWVAKDKFPRPIAPTETLRLWPRRVVEEWVRAQQEKVMGGEGP
jgi:predicted DNA-binding transcriptional regulator AlpA